MFPPPLVGSTGRPMRILLVEDHVDSARALVRLLSKMGYDVTHAVSVSEARRLCSEQSFGLLLSDIQLPDGTGWQLAGEVRAICNIPAIAITARPLLGEAQRYRDAGFYAVLSKPLQVDQLLATIVQAPGATCGPVAVTG